MHAHIHTHTYALIHAFAHARSSGRHRPSSNTTNMRAHADVSEPITGKIRSPNVEHHDVRDVFAKWATHTVATLSSRPLVFTASISFSIISCSWIGGDDGNDDEDEQYEAPATD